MERLTDAQAKILDYLRTCSEEGLPPTIREICSATGMRSTSSVHHHLNVLEEEGFITRSKGLNRAIHIVGDKAPVTHVPLLGKVTAGMPIYAYEEVVATIPFPADKHRSNELFALRVIGDSMVEAGILADDILIAERTPTAGNGEIVIALIGEEATVKYFFKESDHVRLQPDNPMYDPIIVGFDEVSILGRVVSCMRFYN
ncbi:MAG: transcriptional repressor LexA [Oscillospiraceae bacterium]|jgi:repressor LexA|nr:transcriptional repressor LexA [Oscillospiraceae bacterium]